MKDTLKDLWNGNLEPWSEEWEREREARELRSACRGQPPAGILSRAICLCHCL